MIIKISEDNIDDGNPRCRNSCPVALAICLATGNEWQVNAKQISLDGRVIIDLPNCAVDFIERFDDGEPVLPLTFELPI